MVGHKLGEFSPTRQFSGHTPADKKAAQETKSTATATAAAGHTDGVYTVTTAGDAFSLTESFLGGDAVDADGTTVTTDILTYDSDGAITNTSATNNYGTIEALPAFGSVTTTAGGMAATLAGTIATDGAITLNVPSLVISIRERTPVFKSLLGVSVI